MGFGDLKTEAGLNALNEFLADKSYIDGYTPTAADAVVFGAVGKSPAVSHAHALRWYNHMKSYGNDTAKFAGVKKAVGTYGPKGGVPTDADADSDDDLDLFGSDDEEDKAELAKIKEDRIAAYNAKKTKMEEAPQASAPKKPIVDEDDDDDFDLFGDEDDEDAAALDTVKQDRIAAYAAKKAAKPVLTAKSSIILDVKPWDDETDMVEMEKLVRGIEADGLVWGASKLVPVGYGIKKLQIICVVEDDKIGTDFLEDNITGFEELVQSMDIAAFNKI